MGANSYFTQLEQKIQHLLAEKKFQQAYDFCQECVLKFPGEKLFSKLKQQIENIVAEENTKTIREKLDVMGPLWQARKYPEIIRILKDLLIVAPHDKKLNKLLLKAQTDYKKEIDEIQKNFNHDQTKRLEKLLTQDPQKLLDELFSLEKNNPNNNDIQTLTSIFRDRLIEKNIKEKKDLLRSEKLEVIENFIQQLEKIDKSNSRIVKLRQWLCGKERVSQMNTKNEFVYQGTQHLDTLMKLKKYDKVIKAAEEILSIDKENSRAKKMLDQAKKRFFKQSREATVDSILSTNVSLQNEYQQNPARFIKL